MSPNEIDSITHHSGPVTIDVAEAPAEYLELTVDTGMLFIVEEAVESVDVPFSTKTVQLRRRKSPHFPHPNTSHSLPQSLGSGGGEYEDSSRQPYLLSRARSVPSASVGRSASGSSAAGLSKPPPSNLGGSNKKGTTEMFKRIIAACTAAVLAFGIVGLTATAAAATDNECVPTAGVAAYDETVTDAVAYDETVVDVVAYDETVVDEAAHWQRYSYNGDWDQDAAPPFPDENWQANVKGDPHNVGVAGAYDRSNEHSGHVDWFYLEWVAEVNHIVHHDAVTHLVHHEAVTHIVHHDAIPPVVCDEEPNVVTPLIPTLVDQCGPADADSYVLTVPESTSEITYSSEVDTDLNRVRVIAVATEGNVLASGEDKDVWQFVYTDETCPIDLTPCEVATVQTVSTNLHPQGWTLESGEWVDGGVEFTASNWSDAYAVKDVSFPLSAAAILDFDVTGGNVWAIILDTTAGNVHYEPEPYSDDLWTNAPGILPANGGGQGGPYSGNLDDLVSDPTVTQVYLYFTSGSTEPESGVLHSGSFNCVEQPFDFEKTPVIVPTELPTPPALALTGANPALPFGLGTALMALGLIAVAAVAWRRAHN